MMDIGLETTTEKTTKHSRIHWKANPKIRLFILFIIIWMYDCAIAHAGLFDSAVSGEMTADEEAQTDASGQDATSASVVISSSPALTYELNGYIRSTLYAGKIPDRDAAEVKNVYAEPALKLRVGKEAFGDAYADMRFRFEYDRGESITQPDLHEAYVNVYPGPLDIRFGHQVIVWGRADGINPTNNLTPFSWRIRSPNDDDQRLGNLALRMYYNIAPVRLEGVWIPLYRGTELPSLPLPSYISLTEDYPDADLKNSLLAGRVHLELPAFEMSLSYLFGFSPMPGIVPQSIEIDDTGALSVLLARTPYRQHVIGADFSTSVGDLFGLRGEAAYRFLDTNDDKPQNPAPDIFYILGVDREFGDVMIIAQYISRYAFDWQEVDAPASILRISDDAVPDIQNAEVMLAKINQMINSQTAEWQHSAFLRAEWKLFHETLSLEISGLYNFVTEEWLMRPRASYDLTDGLEIALGGELFGGPMDTLFGWVDAVQSAGYAQLMAWF